MSNEGWKRAKGIRNGILFLLFLIPYGSFAQGTWKIIQVPTLQYLKSVCFVDSSYGWIAGDSGIILHTNNGGSSWIRQEINSTHTVEDVFFLDRNQGWAAASNYTTLPFGTILLKTTNGGADWIAQPYPEEDIFINCILYRDSLNGWMGGSPHALLRTRDGGASWTQAAIDTSTLAFFPVLHLSFYNDQYGYASGGMFDIAGVTWHTSNGGEKWYAIDPSQAPADEVHGLHLFDSVNVMGAGGDPDFGYGVGMIRTADAGWNWTYEELDIQGNAHDLDFRNGHEAWAPLGARRKLIYSLDTGATWTEIPSPGNLAIHKMTFPDSLHGFAVGKEGAVLKYHPLVVPSVGNHIPPAQGFELFQNSPNPASAETRIRYTLPGVNDGFPAAWRGYSGTLQITVVDLYGREKARIVPGSFHPGSNEVTVDLTGLAEGIYLYALQIVTQGRSIIAADPRRMIILR
jgi:photosystem II stability/assembly factor-like uncharacterized protein